MGNDPTITRAGPWRILVLDRSADDPKWILATVATPGDVRPAHAAGAVLDEVTIAWVAAAVGLYRTALTPLRHADVWRVDEGGRPR
jgi:hypothetical protein